MKRHANVAIFVPHAGCLHRCTFCDQRGISGQTRPPTPEEAEVEMLRGLESLGEKARDAQIAFFGGSFTAILEDYRLSLLNMAKNYVGRDCFSGIRISTRPDCIDERILDQLAEFDVNAIELGVQSMDDDVLTANKRGHTAKDVRTASELILKHGFSLGHQMMTGLYESTPEKDMLTARDLAALNPATMRIYPTVVISGTELEDLYKKGKYSPQPLDEAVSLCAELLDFFTKHEINVIRVGLHSGGNLTGRLVAGPYHPALRELCESKIMLDRVTDKIKNGDIHPGKIILRIAPGAISKMSGQKRSNMLFLQKMGYDVRIIPDEGMGYLQVDVFQ